MIRQQQHDAMMVLRATAVAAMAHDGQRRKYTGEPYIVHPIAVAETVAEYGGGPQEIAAALLHDTIEDSCGKVTFASLSREFPASVCVLVHQLTEKFVPVPGMNRAKRKKAEAMLYSHAFPSAKFIKLADVLDNTKSIVARDPKFAKVYLAEAQQLLPYLKPLDTPANEQVMRLFDRVESFINISKEQI